MSDAPLPPAGPKACEAIANIMIGHFATRLEVEAYKAGGALSAEAIRALAERFMAEEAARFQPTLKRSWDSCSAAREQRQFESARRRPFDRMLVKTFSHLFQDETVSRRVIPGFNAVVDKMLGPALYEQCQRRAQAILDRYRAANGAYNWAGIHKDPHTHALVDDVLLVVARHFANFERRREWFLSLANSHLTPPQPGAADQYWSLTEHGFAEIMRAVFARLAAADRGALLRRYGDQGVEMLEEFLRRLG